jgi:hypothetical protein
VRKTTILTAAAAALAPRAALACPICFGQSDSPLALGANMGIWVMLGVTGAVLSAFGGFFIHLMRKANMVNNGIESVARAESPAGSDRPEGAEGTAGIASC